MAAGRYRYRASARGFLLCAEELDETLGQLGRDVLGLERAGDVDGVPVGVHEADARGTQVQVDLERPRALGWELSRDVVHEELHALVAARHVGDEFHARSLSSGPETAVSRTALILTRRRGGGSSGGGGGGGGGGGF